MTQYGPGYEFRKYMKLEARLSERQAKIVMAHVGAEGGDRSDLVRRMIDFYHEHHPLREAAEAS